MRIYVYIYIDRAVRVHGEREGAREKERGREKEEKGESSEWKTCTNVQTETRSAHTAAVVSFVIPAFPLACFIVHKFPPHVRAVLYRKRFPPRFNVNRYATVRRTRGKELAEGLARSRFHAFVRRAGGESSLMNNAYV